MSISRRSAEKQPADGLSTIVTQPTFSGFWLLVAYLEVGHPIESSGRYVVYRTECRDQSFVFAADMARKFPHSETCSNRLL